MVTRAVVTTRGRRGSRSRLMTSAVFASTASTARHMTANAMPRVVLIVGGCSRVVLAAGWAGSGRGDGAIDGGLVDVARVGELGCAAWASSFYDPQGCSCQNGVVSLS